MNISVSRIKTLMICTIAAVFFLMIPITSHAEVTPIDNIDKSGAEKILKEFKIPLADGSYTSVSDMSEDYIVFFFGGMTTTCSNNTMGVFDDCQAIGMSVNKVFIHKNEGEDGANKFIDRHPGTMTYSPFSDESVDTIFKVHNGLNQGDYYLPFIYILDKDRKLVWASTNAESASLAEYFGFVPYMNSYADKSEIPEHVYIGDEFNLRVTFAPANTTIIKREWTSSDESVMTVDSNGKCTAVGTGTVTITHGATVWSAE